MKSIGFTTSIPVEIIYSAGFKPVDLNNIFITDKNAAKLIEQAENDGFPRNTCSWIKGIYSAVLNSEDIDTVISVVEGDCSNARALSEVLNLKGIKCIPFSYPNSRNYQALKAEMDKLCREFNTSFEQAIYIKKQLDLIRKRLAYIDELTWKHNKVSGFENHIWQVSSSDFEGDYRAFGEKLEKEIAVIEKREPFSERVRLGYIGVPPINSDLYDLVEEMGARIVYNEVQRQFTMADGIDIDDLVEVYRIFTYPYDLYGRIRDIKNQIEIRKIDGIIHYTQAFCFRGIEDIVLRKELDVPILTLEGDRPGTVDPRSRLRIESFIDMLT
ncbi:2-hydroxyacyl-CoA dehydratase family protein [Acetivibrio clariflavus]|uniref:Benzoyl-CoA reductase/2-hydroxyglutaryl-CoA dehydratase subunit, BcrC/BadD/HgdB n=1 Tax=Acetivibrio clariflavus (strain DSM 19732 / NBRC 101661 / EBR45) TaxID=720554 RepID=G8LWS4_ACECE|nr:2-hydroxyacyl-CoA dehydratase [Acetivibrio clariflavus]AEV69785.1 Benzoyl-CoA reductase/2-hydroxyglutaryl-CoA dehydratase subunit, BcrC/BadD/HgdB [Acetivibrio clariflavus DSM 19732]